MKFCNCAVPAMTGKPCPGCGDADFSERWPREKNPLSEEVVKDSGVNEVIKIMEQNQALREVLREIIDLYYSEGDEPMFDAIEKARRLVE